MRRLWRAACGDFTPLDKFPSAKTEFQSADIHTYTYIHERKLDFSYWQCNMRHEQPVRTKQACGSSCRDQYIRQLGGGDAF